MAGRSPGFKTQTLGALVAPAAAETVDRLAARIEQAFQETRAPRTLAEEVVAERATTSMSLAGQAALA